MYLVHSLSVNDLIRVHIYFFWSCHAISVTSSCTRRSGELGREESCEAWFQAENMSNKNQRLSNKSIKWPKMGANGQHFETAVLANFGGTS